MGERRTKEWRAKVCEMNLSHRREFRLSRIKVQKSDSVSIPVVIFGLRRWTEKMIQEVAAEG
jgi:hypothetical protein